MYTKLQLMKSTKTKRAQVIMSRQRLMMEFFME